MRRGSDNGNEDISSPKKMKTYLITKKMDNDNKVWDKVKRMLDRETEVPGFENLTQMEADWDNIQWDMDTTDLKFFQTLIHGFVRGGYVARKEVKDLHTFI